MNCLLLGNGLNRLSLQLSWQQLLEQLSEELGLQGQVQGHAGKPLSLLFEELCVRLPERNARSAEDKVKARIAQLMGSFPPHALLERLAPLFQTILTTNYDDSVEQALAGMLYTPRPLLHELRYSLFRCTEVGARRVWHVHGEANHPQTIVLGYDHYAGYLQKIRNYATDGVPLSGKRGRIQSPLRAGNHDFERFAPHSWVDHFLRDHVHIVGFGLDFSEIDLWWLLVHKRRRDTQTGRTFFYAIDVDGGGERQEQAKFSVLRSFDVEVVVIDARTYLEGYELVVAEVERNVGRLKEWLPHTVKHRVPRSAQVAQQEQVAQAAGVAQRRLNLRSRRE